MNNTKPLLHPSNLKLSSYSCGSSTHTGPKIHRKPTFLEQESSPRVNLVYEYVYFSTLEPHHHAVCLNLKVGDIQSSTNSSLEFPCYFALILNLQM